MEPTEGSETSAELKRTPGIYPKERIQYLKADENLKSRWFHWFLTSVWGEGEGSISCLGGRTPGASEIPTRSRSPDHPSHSIVIIPTVVSLPVKSMLYIVWSFSLCDTHRVPVKCLLFEVLALSSQTPPSLLPPQEEVSVPARQVNFVWVSGNFWVVRFSLT